MRKIFLKLMINSFYGKAIQNLRKRVNVRLVNNEKDFFKIHQQTTQFIFIVLELRKWLMYDFYYRFIKKHFDAELLSTDTDSLTYKIKSEDDYEEFFKHKHLFDFNNDLKDSKFFDEIINLD